MSTPKENPKIAGGENVLPCLLDRLTVQGSEQDGQNAFHAMARMYQEGVKRDLRWLLNTRAHMSEEELEEFPHVRTSVLNYGCGDLCGQTVSGLKPVDVERDLIEAIRAFEPRILRNSLTIKAASAREGAALNIVAFEIRGEIWAPPFPEPVLIRTELDLESGDFSLL